MFRTGGPAKVGDGAEFFNHLSTPGETVPFRSRGDWVQDTGMTSAPDPAAVLVLYHRANTFGGSFNSVIDVLARVDRNRFTPIASVPGAGNVADRLHDLGIPVLFCQDRPGGRSRAYAAAVAKFSWLLRRRRIRLVYVSDYVTWRSAASFAARVSRIPRVVHVRAPLAGNATDPELLHASMVVGNSRASIEALKDRLPECRRRVVYNFVDFSRFTPGPDRRADWFPERPPVVGFVGIFRPEKGIEYFLEMARLIRSHRPDVRFLAVGGESAVADVGWFEKMRAYAHDLGLDDVMRFTGSRDDVPDLMRSMDVLVVPSLAEGFGRVIVEANAVGVPVVGADAAGIPEVVEPDVTGALVPPRDPGAMARAVMSMLDNQAWRARVRESAPTRVRLRFSEETQMAALQRAWDDALHPQPSTRVLPPTNRPQASHDV